jgi:hypothetical protein
MAAEKDPPPVVFGELSQSPRRTEAVYQSGLTDPIGPLTLRSPDPNRPPGPVNVSVVLKGVAAEGRAGDLSINTPLKPDSGQLRITGRPVGLKIARARGRKAVVIRNKKQLQFQAGLLIQALEQAIGYQSRPQSNDPAPELYRDLALEKVANLRAVKALVVELRRLNDLLAKSKQVKSTQKPVVEVRKHLNTFLGSFAKSAGTGAGVLVIGVAATILHNTGYLDPSILTHRGH